MAFGVRHRRGGYYAPTTWWGKTIQCAYAAFMFAACTGLVGYIQFILLPYKRFVGEGGAFWFVAIWSTVACAALLVMSGLMVILFYCTVREKKF